MVSEALSAIAWILLGGLIGHRLAIGRDERREYNEAVRPMQESLMRFIDNDCKTYGFPLDDKDIYKVKTHLSDRKIKQLDRLIEELKEAHARIYDGFDDSSGRYQKIRLDELPIVRKTVADIQKFLKAKII